jgi:1-hydroxy-2-naphthoate dioxygenase
MIWLDGLDTPLVQMLEAGFYEEYHRERQDLGAAVNPSPWHYPMSEMRAALQRRADAAPGAAGDGIILEYTNRAIGGLVMPTIACYMQLLRPGEQTRACRRVCCTNFHVVEGAGPALREQTVKRLADLGPEQGIIDPALGLIHIEFGRHHIEIAREYDRHTCRQELRGVCGQSIEPAQLVVELWAGGGVPVGQI